MSDSSQKLAQHASREKHCKDRGASNNCTGQICHQKIDMDYKMSQDQKLASLQEYGNPYIKEKRCVPRTVRSLPSRRRVASSRKKPMYTGSEHCPQFSGKFAGGGEEVCNSSSRPDGRGCTWAKKGRKCRVKPEKKVYVSEYNDTTCNRFGQKRQCGKYGKPLGCKWFKGRKAGKSAQMQERYGKKGCWNADPAAYGGLSKSSIDKGSFRASDVPEGSCQGLTLAAKDSNDAYHLCYSRPYCKIKKLNKKKGNNLHNLRCEEIPRKLR